MPQQITVYSKPRCVQCNATYKALDKTGVDYTVIDVTEDTEAFDFIIALGYQQVPVVVTNDTHWSGFRPDKCKAAAKEVLSQKEMATVA